MPYYGADFEGAMKPYRREVKWSYLSAIWYYWHHTHADGLPDDDGVLQNVCECPDADWARTKGVIFGGKPFFYLIGGKWHQDRAKEEYSETVKIYNSKIEAASRARAAKSDANLSPNVRTNLDPNDSPKPQLQSQPQPSSNTHTPGAGKSLPSLEDVKAKASMVGISEADAEAFWHHYEASGWVDKHGNPVVKWESKLVSWGIGSRSRPAEAAHHANTPAASSKPNGAQIVAWNQELERALKERSTIRGTYGDHQTMSKRDADRLSKLNARIKELKAALGVQI